MINEVDCASMREISVHRDPTVVGFQKSILESAGILCFIRNEHTSASMGAGMMGLFQSHIFDPVLCIVDDDRYEEAVKLIAAPASYRTSERPDWKCPVCGEQVPGSFETCWKCPAPETEE